MNLGFKSLEERFQSGELDVDTFYRKFQVNLFDFGRLRIRKMFDIYNQFHYGGGMNFESFNGVSGVEGYEKLENLAGEDARGKFLSYSLRFGNENVSCELVNRAFLSFLVGGAAAGNIAGFSLGQLSGLFFRDVFEFFNYNSAVVSSVLVGTATLTTAASFAGSRSFSVLNLECKKLNDSEQARENIKQINHLMLDNYSKPLKPIRK